jgi:hypothetical protein
LFNIKLIAMMGFKMPVDIMVEKDITARKRINWKHAVLVVPTLYALFLMIKLVYEPVEPIIIMNEPTAELIATAPADSGAREQTSQSSPDSSNQLLLPNESAETLPPVASQPAEAHMIGDAETGDTAKTVIGTDAVAVDKGSEQLSDTELAKKNAKQKAKKKPEELIQQSPTELKPPLESQPQQSIVVQQKAPAVVATEAKKDTVTETAKEVVKEASKAPAQEKSPWSVFADSIMQGGETPCTPAQIAMNQCS